MVRIWGLLLVFWFSVAFLASGITAQEADHGGGESKQPSPYSFQIKPLGSRIIDRLRKPSITWDSPLTVLNGHSIKARREAILRAHATALMDEYQRGVLKPFHKRVNKGNLDWALSDDAIEQALQSDPDTTVGKFFISINQRELDGIASTHPRITGFCRRFLYRSTHNAPIRYSRNLAKETWRASWMFGVVFSLAMITFEPLRSRIESAYRPISWKAWNLVMAPLGYGTAPAEEAKHQATAIIDDFARTQVFSAKEMNDHIEKFLPRWDAWCVKGNERFQAQVRGGKWEENGLISQYQTHLNGIQDRINNIWAIREEYRKATNPDERDRAQKKIRKNQEWLATNLAAIEMYRAYFPYILENSDVPIRYINRMGRLEAIEMAGVENIRQAFIQTFQDNVDRAIKYHLADNNTALDDTGLNNQN